MAQQAVSTDGGRDLLAELLEPLLTHLAVGTGGTALLDGDGVPLAGVKQRTGLNAEIGRTRVLERHFVVEDPDGALVAAPIEGGSSAKYSVSATPTNLVYLAFRFLDAEAHGTWNEAALFGGGAYGGVVYNTRGATLFDGAQSGDDRAGVDVILGGNYTPNENQTITVTVTTGGGSGVAKVGWTSTGTLAAAVNQTITFGVAKAIGASGLTLTFDGGDDGVLTIGDQVIIRARQGTDTADYASGGVYNALTNEDGQVANPGRLVRLVYLTGVDPKGSTTVDVTLVVSVLNLDG